MTTDREFWIIKRSLSNAYTTFRHPVTRECQNVPLVEERIGPFGGVAACADWLSENAATHCIYAIEILRRT